MRKTTLLLMVMVLMLSACGAATEEYAPSEPALENARFSDDSVEVVAEMEEEAAEEAAYDGDEAAVEDTGSSTGEAQQAQALNRKIIYTAYLQLRVDDPREVASNLNTLAAQYGGYISSANIYEFRTDSYRADVQLRVDAERFNIAIEALRDLSTEILSEQRDSQDVTDRYVDLQARIENLERTEAELQILLTEARENRGKTEDILSVYRELTSIRGEIESYQGQLNVLSDSVSLATINVEFIPPEMQVEIVDEGWSPMSTVRIALRDLTKGVQDLIDLTIIFVLNVLPCLLLLGAIGYGLYRLNQWVQQQRQPQKNVSPTPPNPPTSDATTTTKDDDEA